MTGEGACDADPAPLRNWDFLLQTNTGLSWDLHTDALGDYEAWLPAIGSLYTITLSAHDHALATSSGIVISAAAKHRFKL